MREQLTQAWAAFLSGRETSVALRSIDPRAVPGEIPEALRARLERSDRLRARLRQAPTGAAPGRWSEWVAAREAELEVEETLVAAGVPAERILSSVTHHRDQVLCVGVESAGLVAIGVDLESRDREVNAAVIARIVQPQEAAHRLEFIDYWVIKEAAFKACPASSGAVSLVPSIVLQSWDAQKSEGTVVSPSLQAQGLLCRVARVEVGGFKIGFAFSSRGPELRSSPS